MTKPTVHVIAGPNGAGKTTFAMSYLNAFAGCREFLNADLIAAGLSPFNPDSQAIPAGRLMLGRIEELNRQRATFAIETTLAGRGHAQRLARLKSECGFQIELIFVWLPTADFAVDRVANRVRQGGHNIPEPVIRRRFDQGISNFAKHYAPVANRWAILNGTWYPPSPVVLHENNQTVSFDNNAIKAIQTRTPNLLDKPPATSTEPTSFFDRLESAASETTQTIVASAVRVPTPILVWGDGETVRINSITERRIPDHVGDDWMD
ncbi:AAA family ATPase [Aporhodopirellula aestuarii]|uniref:AAA family ATPase n=1 Tax=Aporhodopirellula aestuarii TaxID=2950107 RepID=A0ABT0U1C6_9BACT|nr:AAA family ATPase [Aporhodopirellula aestuarii]MCM2370699.1 AAA family ATPase [Aporhodopirellula aestuarii]